MKMKIKLQQRDKDIIWMGLCACASIILTGIIFPKGWF